MSDLAAQSEGLFLCHVGIESIWGVIGFGSALAHARFSIESLLRLICRRLGACACIKLRLALDQHPRMSGLAAQFCSVASRVN
jgi:hypothetical protein